MMGCDGVMGGLALLLARSAATVSGGAAGGHWKFKFELHCGTNLTPKLASSGGADTLAADRPTGAVTGRGGSCAQSAFG